MKRFTGVVVRGILAVATALSSLVWVPMSAPAVSTATVTLNFLRAEVAVTATFETQQTDGTWSVEATGTGMSRVTASLPLNSTVRMRIDDPTGFYTPGWLKVKPGSSGLEATPNAEDAATFVLTASGSADVVLQGAGIIRGRIVSDRGEPLDGVKVTAWRQIGYGGSFTGTADASGVVEIKGVTPSEYRLRASDPKARIAGDMWVAGVSPYFTGDRLTVPRAPDAASFDATLPIGCQVSGVVRRDVDGAPVSGIAVECWQYYDDPSLGPVQRVRTATTASDGSYTVTGLSAATHELRFGGGWTGPEFPRTIPSFVALPGDTLSRDVTLTVGAFVTGSTGVTPVGTWSEAPYNPGVSYTAHTYLQAYRLNPATGEFAAQLPSDQYTPGLDVTGSFRTRIAPGRYRFSFTGYHVIPRTLPESDSTTATIEAAAGATIDLGPLGIARHTIIRGAAQKEGQETWLNSGNVFTLWKKQPDGSFDAVGSQYSVDSSGRFRFAGDLSGTFKITGKTSAAGYRTWAWPDGTDLESGQEFVIERSEYRDMSTHTIQMIAGTLQATVKGLTYDESGEPVTVPLPGAIVIVYRSIGWGPQEIGRLTADANGAVSTSLPEGAYMLRVVDPAGVHSTQEFGFDGGSIYVTADDVTDLGDLELPKKGRIGGWVVSQATGGPIAGVQLVPEHPTFGSLPASVTDASGFFETGLMDWDLWDMWITDPWGRFAPQWWGQTFYPGVGDTQHWEIAMEPIAPQIERANGANRYESCASAVAKSYAYADEIIVATGAAFPDALAGAPLSAAAGAPLLLVQPNSVPPAIANEIKRLGPNAATVLGGTGSVSDAVIDQLVALGIPRDNIRRIAGGNRYETAAKVGLEVYRLNGWTAEDDVTAYVASGASFADALSASSVAAMEGMPLLLVAANQLPSTTSSALRQIAPDHTVVAGGESVVGDAVVASLPSARRVAGASRYGTNAALLGEALDHAEADGYYYDGLVVASGTTFPDALVGAAICSRRNALLVLVDAQLPQVSRPAVQRLGDGAMSLITMGGQGAVSGATENVVRGYIR